jgi:hypothetical protein
MIDLIVHNLQNNKELETVVRGALFERILIWMLKATLTEKDREIMLDYVIGDVKKDLEEALEEEIKGQLVQNLLAPPKKEMLKKFELELQRARTGIWEFLSDDPLHR